MNPIRLPRAAAEILLAALPLLAEAAAAQGAPPTPANDPAVKPVVGYLLILLLAGIVLAISLYPSKRSHQDV